MSKATGTVLVTGGTSGLGYHCTLQIAKWYPQYRILIASRSDPDSAATSINQITSQNNVEYVKLDLSSLTKIRSFVASYEKKDYPPIQALVLNAGLQIITGITYTDDKIETTFAVNHVGHALLFYLLRPHLAPKARIVNVSSGVHDPAQKTGLPDPIYDNADKIAHPTAETAKFHGRQRYATSKLCNVMWTYALNKRLEKGSSGQNWTVTALDPGMMPGTGLARDASAGLQFVWKTILPRLIWLLRLLVSPNIHTMQESGLALAKLAVGKEVEGKSGLYFEGQEERKSSHDSYVVEKQEDLWEWTVKAVAKDEEEKRQFESVYVSH